MRKIVIEDWGWEDEGEGNLPADPKRCGYRSGSKCTFTGRERIICKKVCSECQLRNRDPVEVDRELREQWNKERQKGVDKYVKWCEQHEQRGGGVEGETRHEGDEGSEPVWKMLASEVFGDVVDHKGRHLPPWEEGERVEQYVAAQRVATHYGSAGALIRCLNRNFPDECGSLAATRQRISRLRKQAGTEVDSRSRRQRDPNDSICRPMDGVIPWDDLAETFFPPEMFAVVPSKGRTVADYLRAPDVSYSRGFKQTPIAYMAKRYGRQPATVKNWITKLNECARQ